MDISGEDLAGRAFPEVGSGPGGTTWRLIEEEFLIDQAGTRRQEIWAEMRRILKSMTLIDEAKGETGC